jgi:hypothetical protein
MTAAAALTVPAGETGVLRVFALNMPPEHVRFLDEAGALDGVLGVLQVDPAHVEIFPVSDLEEVGLAGYLTEGCGVSKDRIAPDRARLNALTGSVMIVFSRAFGGRAVTLHPASELTLIGTYAVEATNWTGAPIATESAKPGTGAALPPRAARATARRTGGIIFAVFMLLILAVIVLVVT